MLELFNIAVRLVVSTAPVLWLENLTGQGLRIEWEVEKHRGSTPDHAMITIYNLDPVFRLAIENALAIPVPLIVSLSVGWGKIPMQLFRGQVWRANPNKKRVQPWETPPPQRVPGRTELAQRTPVDVRTVLECGDGLQPLRDTPPAGGAAFGIGIQLAISQVLGQLGLRPSAAALGLIASAAGQLPVQVFQFVADGDPKDLLDDLMASIGLSWGIQGDEFVVFRAGLRNDVPPSILAPQSGLLSWDNLDDGGVEFEALAQARVAPGVQVSINNEFGIPQGGGPLRVERVMFSGSSEGPSIMRGVARKVQVV